MKKFSFLGSLMIVVVTTSLFAGTAFAATPTLSLTSNGDGDNIQVSVTGDPSTSVLLFYTKTNVGTQIASLGTTDSSGHYSTTISSTSYVIASASSVYVKTGGLNGTQSASVNWPTVTTSGNFSLNPTGLVLSVGQSSTITVTNNAGNAVYLSNNSNPPVANANISGNQITITAITNGSAVFTFCTTSTTQTCASSYVAVQNGSGNALSFSLSNVTVSPGQSVPITITGGNGTYSVLSNSNSSVIQSNISGITLTLTANNTSGSASIAICGSDMKACGIVNATAGSSSTANLNFSPSNPTVGIGQTLNVTISGGTVTNPGYYVSSNSNSGALSTSISGSKLVLSGITNGTASLVICSSNGSCGTLIAISSYVSSGGTVTLSQNTITLLAGQVLSVTVSGGTTPYSLNQTSSGTFQASINGNVVAISGIAAGASNLNVCSAGGACATLSVTVNASGVGMPISFSQNNLNLAAGNITGLSITGAGGYYVSTSDNSSAASVQISGNTALVTALNAGNTNVSICQSGGQCSILFVTVTAGTVAGSTPVFSQTNPTIPSGQVLTETISGGASGNYYFLTNTNPSIVQISLTGIKLTLTGTASGSTYVVICAASNSCGVLNVTVSGTSASTAIISFTTTSVQAAVISQAYTSQLLTTGGSGSYVFSLASGSLPAGLILSSSGLISGTPTAIGNSTFSVKAVDGVSAPATYSFTLTVNSATVSTPPPLNSSAYSNGQLISEKGTIYIVYLNTKVGFANAEAFLGLGFKFNNVTAVTNSGLQVSPKTVITADGSHPRGSWVSNGKLVYFVSPDGIIPVADWNVFINNGGQASFITKVNKYDLARAKLSVMTLNDSRLN
jgi:ferredoxin/plastocyanin